MRTSTLATFDEVSTVTDSVSPAFGVVELRPNQRICGAASGGSIRIVGVGAGDGGCEGVAETLGTGEGTSAPPTAIDEQTANSPRAGTAREKSFTNATV